MIKKRWFILGLIVLGGIIVAMLFNLKKSPIQKIEEKLLIDLEGLVSVVQVQEDKKFGEEHIYAKLLIEEGKRKVVEKQLKDSLIDASERKVVPNFKRTCLWWDVNDEHVTARYTRFLSGKRVKTIEVWAFIVEAEKEYMYISY